jgi:hypothetical protein
MSRLWAISSATQALCTMLEQQIPLVEPTLEELVVSTLPVDEVAPDPASSQLNLCLFRVQTDIQAGAAGLRATPGGLAAAGGPLSLGYVLSVATSTPTSLVALGAALAVLEQQPVLQAADAADDHQSFSSLSISELALSLTDSSALWRMLRVPYRPSIALDVRVLPVTDAA